jgi:hypothetical protein
MKKYPAEYFFSKMIQEGLGCNQLPAVAGFCLPGTPGVFISDPSFLEDIYVTKNA